MKKLFFFDLDSLQEYNYVKIKHHQLKNCGEIISKRNDVKQIGWGSVFKQNNITQIIFSGWLRKKYYSHDGKLYLLKSKNEYKFNIDNTTPIVLENNGHVGVHQCVTFHNKYLLVGGAHILLKNKLEYLIEKKLAGHTSKCLKNMVIDKRKGYNIISNKYNQKECKSNGLYLLESNNLLNWENIHDTPLKLNITNKIIKSHITDRIMSFPSRKWSSLDLYDTQPSFFYDEKKEKYVLYTRDNVKTGVRYVEYHESSDLMYWNGPFPIKTSFDYFHDNIYYFKVKYYPKYDYYTAFAKYYSPTYKINGIYLFLSNDGISWKRASKILNDTDTLHYYSSIFEGCPIISKRKMIFYTSYKLSKINIYSLRIDGYSSIYASNKEGFFITKKLILNSDNIRINSLSSCNGYIKVELLDVKMKPISGYELKNFDIVNGNHVEKILSWKNESKILYEDELHIRICMKNSNIYSLIY